MIASFEHHPILINDAALDRGVVMVSVEVTIPCDEWCSLGR